MALVRNLNLGLFLAHPRAHLRNGWETPRLAGQEVPKEAISDLFHTFLCSRQKNVETAKEQNGGKLPLRDGVVELEEACGALVVVRAWSSCMGLGFRV